MATLNVKNMPDALHKKLKARAKQEHRSVAQEVIHLLSRELDEPERLSLLELEGLGKEVWQGIDAAKYIDEERRSWDRPWG